MRIAFMGTPEFAVPCLRALLDAGYEVAGVFTQPDRPAGRGNRLVAPPVKVLAEENHVPVFQFERLRRPEGVEALTSLHPDLCVTAAFGQILSKTLLDIPKFGTVNVHASLLPKYRGSAPIVQAVLAGETETGVTTMLTNEGLDTGDMLLSRKVDILPEETAGELTERLSAVGAALLLDTLRAMENGTLVRVPQNPDEASYQPMLKKEDALIDFSKSADEVANAVRAFNPWPCAYTFLPDGGTLKIWKTKTADLSGTPGTVLVSGAKEGLFVACGTGAIELLEIQAPNSKRMTAKAYLMGKTIPVSTLLGGNTDD